MKYVAAIPVVLLFAILDVLVLASVFAIVGLFVVLTTEDKYPYSYTFAKGVWLR